MTKMNGHLKDIVENEYLYCVLFRCDWLGIESSLGHIKQY